MADSTGGDTEVQYLGLLTSFLISLIAGLVAHAFIISVNVNDWWKGRSLTPVDHIVTSLGITRLCAQCAFTLYTILVSLREWNLLVTLVIIGRFYALLTYTNFWLTSFLSIIFCLKITNFNTRLFLYLRRMILQRTVYFIVASVFFSASYCLIPLSVTISEVTPGRTYNNTGDNQSTDCRNINFIYNFIIGAIIPLLFYFISSVLLFTLLYQHITRMKMSSNLTINLETYYSVMTFVSLTLLYNTIYFAGQFVAIFWYFFCCADLPLLYLFLDFLPVLHSSYMIYRTAKLRNPISKVLWNIVVVLFQRKVADTGENIEVVAQ